MIIKDNQLVATSLSNLNITELNPMQEAALNESLSNKDLILLSPTGSGKTLAYLLPLIVNISQQEQDSQGVKALILVPSRELALQIESVFKAMKTPWKCCCCYGGHPISVEKRSIEGNNPAVIIGTPGRVTDHIFKDNFSTEAIETLIIDEFDKSLEFGFHDDMMDIIGELPNLKKRILLSATDAEQIPEFTGLNETTKLNYLVEDEDFSSRLIIKKLFSESKDKIETLYALLCTLGSSSSIVFCNHRDAVDRINNLLAEKGLYTERFHGGMEQPDREKALYKYRNGSCNILVSTDLAARGLDIPEVEHVIHYHLPNREDAFTHRNGRTARWDAEGTSYIILSREETLPMFLNYHLDTLTLPKTIPSVPAPLWTTLYIGKGKKDKLSKMDIAGFLYKKGNLVREEVGQIDVREHYSFVAVKRSKVASLMRSIKGEKIKGIKVLIEEAL